MNKLSKLTHAKSFAAAFGMSAVLVPALKRGEHILFSDDEDGEPLLRWFTVNGRWESALTTDQSKDDDMEAVALAAYHIKRCKEKAERG